MTNYNYDIIDIISSINTDNYVASDMEIEKTYQYVMDKLGFNVIGNTKSTSRHNVKKYLEIAAGFVFIIAVLTLLIPKVNQQIPSADSKPPYPTFNNKVSETIPIYKGGSDMGMGYILEREEPSIQDTAIVLINPLTGETIDFTGEWEYVLTVATGGVTSDNCQHDPNYIIDYSQLDYKEYIYFGGSGKCYIKRIEGGSETEKTDMIWSYILREGSRVGIELKKDGSPYLYILYFVGETDEGTVLFQAIDVSGGDVEKGENFTRIIEFKSSRKY